MVTKSSSKSRKKTAKQSAKKAAKPSAKKAAKKSVKKAAAKTGVKTAGKRPAKSAKGKTSSAKLSKAVAASSNFTVIPVTGPDAEDKITCRTKTALSLIPGIFKRLDTDNDPTNGNPRFTFVLADANAIFLSVPNCNPDGFFYIPERSANIASITAPNYLGTGAINKIRVTITIADNRRGFTLAFRVRFQENYNVTNKFNPKRLTTLIQVV